MENGAVVGFLLAARPAGQRGEEQVRRGMEKPSRKKGRRGMNVDDERLGCRGPCVPIRRFRRPDPKEDVHARR